MALSPNEVQVALQPFIGREVIVRTLKDEAPGWFDISGRLAFDGISQYAVPYQDTEGRVYRTYTFTARDVSELPHPTRIVVDRRTKKG